MTSLAVVVLAHADPQHLQRLVKTLEDVPVFLHCDARTAAPVYQQMVDRLPKRVTVVRRIRTTLASWSLVRAELEALRAALAATSARHIAVLSGADYPLASMEDLHRELQRWDGTSWIWNTPLPVPAWETPRHHDGGMWRLRYRYLTRDDQVLFYRGYPLRWPISRTVPPDLEVRANSQWKIYARHHARTLLQIADTRPDLIRFWRTTLVPDETFVASMLGSAALVGQDALAPCPLSAWYIDWDNPASPGHPTWLTELDFDRLKAARRADPVGP
jgi:hypothetical protein